MRSIAAILALSLLCVGCGIPNAVGDECGPDRRAYDALMKKSNGLRTRGVEVTAPITRDTRQQLARAREAVIRCTGQSG